jgi:hypothetical protein
MKQITFNQYRTVDIAILCGLTALFEGIATYATNSWFVLQAMAISVTLVMVCITMMRWGWQAVLPSFIGSFVYCLACRLIGCGGTFKQFIIYCFGSLFCLIPLVLLKKLGKERVRLSGGYRCLFVICTYLSIVLGRWLVSLIFEFSFSSLIGFITSDILSLLFAIVVVSLAKSIDGLIEDQKHYLLRLDRERKEQQGTVDDNF